MVAVQLGMQYLVQLQVFLDISTVVRVRVVRVMRVRVRVVRVRVGLRVGLRVKGEGEG